jgi:hypothetical protein
MSLVEQKNRELYQNKALHFCYISSFYGGTTSSNENRNVWRGAFNLQPVWVVTGEDKGMRFLGVTET